MPTQPPVHVQPDPDRVVPHLAVRALVSLNAVDACLAAIDGPHHAGALRAIRSMHDPRAVEGLIKRLSTAYSSELRRDILSTLIRLYHKEADYDGSWWGIRPDSTGPYYDGRPWEASPRIEAVVRSALLDGDEQTVQFLLAELSRHQVRLSGLPAASALATQHDETDKPLVIAKADPNNPEQIGNLSYEVAAQRTLSLTGDPVKGKALFASQSCRSCHTDADGQTPKGPHLVDIGKRYAPEQLIESILKPSAKFAQGYETYAFAMTDGRVFTGFVVSERAGSVLIREATGIPRELQREEIDERQRQEQSAMPEGIVGNLTAVDLADLVAYLRGL
jgi:putative heme-binding domain-containing protein